MTGRHEQSRLDDALADSFPASDPPAMTVPAPPDPAQASASTRSLATPTGVTLVYRVVSADEGATAFAAQPPYHAGRWTSEGTPALYASLSAGAALLEKLVHLDDKAAGPLVLAIGSMPSAGLAEVSLPPEWKAFPHRASVQRAGDAWLQAHRHLGIRVPSAVLPAESNVVFDVDHPGFAQVTLLRIHPVDIDLRLMGIAKPA